MPAKRTGRIQIEFTSEFKRNLRSLAKKYRHIRSDIEPIIEQLQSGNFVGDQVPRTNYAIFKVRVKNKDINKGKSAGYRIIYYLKTKTSVILVTIYSKTEQSDVSPNRIRRIVEEFEWKK